MAKQRYRPHCILANLLITSIFGIGTAFAEDSNLFDLQPCPEVLGVEGGAQPTKKWDLTISPFTYHWTHNPEHKNVVLVGIDSHLKGDRFCGLALFTNSFGQGSAYGYVGQQWNGIFGNPNLFTKVSAGLIYGYRGQYKNKIPFNNLGIAPAIIPSIGYAFSPKDSAQIFLLGIAGLNFTYTRSF